METGNESTSSSNMSKLFPLCLHRQGLTAEADVFSSAHSGVSWNIDASFARFLPTTPGTATARATETLFTAIPAGASSHRLPQAHHAATLEAHNFSLRDAYSEPASIVTSSWTHSSPSTHVNA